MCVCVCVNVQLTTVFRITHSTMIASPPGEHLELITTRSMDKIVTFQTSHYFAEGGQ